MNEMFLASLEIMRERRGDSRDVTSSNNCPKPRDAVQVVVEVKENDRVGGETIYFGQNA